MKSVKLIHSKIHFFIGVLLISNGLFLNSCDSQTKTERENVQVLQKIYDEGINEQNLEVIESLLAEDYVRHCQAMPPDLQVIRGRDNMMGFFRSHFLAFPDWREEIEIKAVDNDVIAYTSRGVGTQTGQAGNLPPTGRTCDLDHIIIQRFENGKIAETWVSWDNLTFLGQLGHIPSDAINDIE